jgi:electron transport complex protein RnfB
LAAPYDHYKTIPHPPVKITQKKKKPKMVAVVDEDNCTGCQACVPFCPVDCIRPLPPDKYGTPIPPVQILFNECIGCSVCARVCSQLTWDAIEILPTADFETRYNIELTDAMTPPYGIIRSAINQTGS